LHFTIDNENDFHYHIGMQLQIEEEEMLLPPLMKRKTLIKIDKGFILLRDIYLFCKIEPFLEDL